VLSAAQPAMTSKLIDIKVRRSLYSITINLSVHDGIRR
jgi:hypothetical protein